MDIPWDIAKNLDFKPLSSFRTFPDKPVQNWGAFTFLLVHPGILNWTFLGNFLDIPRIVRWTFHRTLNRDSNSGRVKTLILSRFQASDVLGYDTADPAEGFVMDYPWIFHGMSGGLSGGHSEDAEQHSIRLLFWL